MESHELNRQTLAAIIKIIRDNFEEKGNAPMVRTICKETGLKLKDIYELFPLGPARGACRAGRVTETRRVRSNTHDHVLVYLDLVSCTSFLCSTTGGIFCTTFKTRFSQGPFAKVREYCPSSLLLLYWGLYVTDAKRISTLTPAHLHGRYIFSYRKLPGNSRVPSFHACGYFQLSNSY